MDQTRMSRLLIALVALGLWATSPRQQYAQGAARVTDFGARVGGKAYPATISAANDTDQPQTVQVIVTGAPWISFTGPSTVVVPPGSEAEVPVQIDLAGLPPGTHTVVVTFACATCPGGPRSWTETATVRTVPDTMRFGDSPADAGFGGLVNGQPVDVCALLNNVLGEMEQSAFGATPHGRQILTTLKTKYFENGCSDVTFVTTADEVRPDGKLAKTGGLAADGDAIGPGEAQYARRSSVFDVVVLEEIYIGLDLQRTSVLEARRNPSEYYVFTYQGQLGVIKKSDLVHNIAHEGLHAVQAGKYNVPTRDATTANPTVASSIEEEQEGKRIGDEATTALKLPPSVDSIGGYGGRGPNAGYVPIAPLGTQAVTPSAPTSSVNSSPTPRVNGTETQSTGPPGASVSRAGGGGRASGPAMAVGHIVAQPEPLATSARGGVSGAAVRGNGLVELTVSNAPVLTNRKVSEKTQNMGASALGFTEEATVVARRSEPWVPPAWGSRVLLSWAPARRPWGVGQGAGAANNVLQVVFTSLGKSSGDAFTMTVQHTGAGPLRLLASGFVLQPIENLTQAEVERALAKLPGARATATVSAYCLDMPKLAPRAGTLYRLAPPAVQQRYASLPRIMEASIALKNRGDLHPDGDPETYFHAIRQWALWTVEQGFGDQNAFTRAFLDHSRKNLEAAGRRWTREVEQAVRGVLPNRWNDIQAVLSLADVDAR